eukprot:6207947-Pleurochrysis_carterae.AAC.7
MSGEWLTASSALAQLSSLFAPGKLRFIRCVQPAKLPSAPAFLPWMMHAVPVFTVSSLCRSIQLVRTPTLPRKEMISFPSCPTLATNATSGAGTSGLPAFISLATSAAATAVFRLLPPAE